jgi:hypothetical protein
MAVNLDKPKEWTEDIDDSVDMYNKWFMEFAPKTFRATQIQATEDVKATLAVTDNLKNIQPCMLRKHPELLPTLRMSTCPPLAVDRLIGFSGATPSLIKCMEEGKKLPVRMSAVEADTQLGQIATIIDKMIDLSIFVWLGRKEPPTEIEIRRAATIVADRLSTARANPIIRNEQEKRQLAVIKTWLEARQYRQLAIGEGTRFHALPPGTFSFRMNVPVE